MIDFTEEQGLGEAPIGPAILLSGNPKLDEKLSEAIVRLARGPYISSRMTRISSISSSARSISSSSMIISASSMRSSRLLRFMAQNMLTSTSSPTFHPAHLILSTVSP